MAPAASPATGVSWRDRSAPIIKRWVRPVLWALVILPIVIIAIRLVLGRLGANPIEALEHETGRWTLRLLASALAITPLINFTRWGWLIAQRRFLGLATFYYAALHLTIYIGVDNFFNVSDIVEDVLKHLYITVGMLGFFLLLPLAITSTTGWIKRLGGKRWNQLHRLVYVAATAGCVHFLWAVKKDKTEPLVYAAVFVTLFAMRFVPAKGRRAST